MGKYRINHTDWEYEDYEYEEKFKKSNRKKNNDGRDFLESQGKSSRGRKGDSFISKRTKGRSRN